MKKTLILSLLAVCSLSIASMHAHEGHDHPAANVPQAASAEEAWKNAQASFKAIQTAAAAKQQAQIHTEQEKLAAYLKQVQDKATGGDKARRDGAIKNAITASERVHAAADANDFAKVESSLKTLEATMGLVEKQLGGAK
ncbi:MAG TPA: hypothetical protein VG095_06020 [Chthoniobacterales bacterium]|nr:hypothetical protein [Chthoniobacterales bacterium]